MAGSELGPFAVDSLSCALSILPNLLKDKNNWPHQTDSDGNCIQTKTVLTIVRVGLKGPLPATPVRVTMSLLDAAGEITAVRITAGKRLYNESTNSMTQEMRPAAPDSEAESDGGEARRACVAEATFSFKFSMTSQQDIIGATKDTPVWLKYVAEGTPDLNVCTEPFRLLARKEKLRVTPAGRVLSAHGKLRDQVLSQEGRVSPSPSPSPDLNPSRNPVEP